MYLIPRIRIRYRFLGLLIITVLGMGTVIFSTRSAKANTEQTNSEQGFLTVPNGSAGESDGDSQVCSCSAYIQGTGYKTCSMWQCYRESPLTIPITASKESLDNFNFTFQFFMLYLGIIIFLILTIGLVYFFRKR